jgi:inosine-uridine nucleoside N-ribohydrolase
MIIETDLGHDPDDFLAITWLIAKGYDIDAILIHPGHPHQIAIARFILKECGLSIPVGVSGFHKNEIEPTSIHKTILSKYKFPFFAAGDGLGKNFCEPAGMDYLIIGPVSNFGEYCKKYPDILIDRATMQGGFCPYSIHNLECQQLDKFKDKFSVGTFNLNGDNRGAFNFLKANITVRQMVGKNVCHTVSLSKEQEKHFDKPKNRAGELFIEALKLINERQDFKKIHDMVAAVCHIKPEFGTWIRGKPFKDKNGWGTIPDNAGDDILVNIDYDKMWKEIYAI